MSRNPLLPDLPKTTIRNDKNATIVALNIKETGTINENILETKDLVVQALTLTRHDDDITNVTNNLTEKDDVVSLADDDMEVLKNHTSDQQTGDNLTQGINASIHVPDNNTFPNKETNKQQ